MYGLTILHFFMFSCSMPGTNFRAKDSHFYILVLLVPYMTDVSIVQLKELSGTINGVNKKMNNDMNHKT